MVLKQMLEETRRPNNPFLRTVLDCRVPRRIFLTTPTGSPGRAVLPAVQCMTSRTRQSVREKDVRTLSEKEIF